MINFRPLIICESDFFLTVKTHHYLIHENNMLILGIDPYDEIERDKKFVEFTSKKICQESTLRNFN